MIKIKILFSLGNEGFGGGRRPQETSLQDSVTLLCPDPVGWTKPSDENAGF